MALNQYFEMSQGSGSKMYTLWRAPMGSGYVKPSYIKNLFVDKDAAWTEAQELAKKAGVEVYDASVDKLKKIVREGDGLMPFGKHYGEPISELLESYLCWLADGGQVKGTEETRGGEVYTYTNFLASDYVKEIALKICIERGYFIEFEGQFRSCKLVDFIENERKGWGHHHADKSKVELELKLIKKTGYDSMYGWISIYTYVDVNSELKYEYKGTSPIYSDDENVPMKIKATVKLGEYRGTQKTYLQRMKLI